MRTLPWTGMPMFVAPIAGVLCDRIGSRPLMAAGLALQAGRDRLAGAVSSSPTVPYAQMLVSRSSSPAPAWRSCSRRRPTPCSARCAREEAGQASGATNAIRELGGVLGVAVLASVFSAHGSYASPQAFTDGMTSAIWVGAAVLAGRRRGRAADPGPHQARGEARRRQACAPSRSPPRVAAELERAAPVVSPAARRGTPPAPPGRSWSPLQEKIAGPDLEAGPFGEYAGLSPACARPPRPAAAPAARSRPPPLGVRRRGDQPITCRASRPA